MSSRPRIREALIEDYEQLCELFEEVDRIHRESLPGLFRAYEGPAPTGEYIEGIIQPEDSAVLVAERDGRIAGLVHLMICDPPDLPVFERQRYLEAESAPRGSIGPFQSRDISYIMYVHHPWAPFTGRMRS